jgi:hypothetical protein
LRPQALHVIFLAPLPAVEVAVDHHLVAACRAAADHHRDAIGLEVRLHQRAQDVNVPTHL